MRTWYGSAIGAAVVLALTATAEAQTRRSQPARSPSSPAANAPLTSPAGRGPDLYSQPAGRSGTIGPSTPNASGNLGGPGTGGGGGYGG